MKSAESLRKSVGLTLPQSLAPKKKGFRGVIAARLRRHRHDGLRHRRRVRRRRGRVSRGGAFRQASMFVLDRLNETVRITPSSSRPKAAFARCARKAMASVLQRGRRSRDQPDRRAIRFQSIGCFWQNGIDGCWLVVFDFDVLNRSLREKATSKSPHEWFDFNVRTLFGRLSCKY